MFGFGKNKEVKDEDFKDLKPENRKKRKEPPKPWGKKERYFIAIVLGLSVFSSLILFLWGRNGKAPGLPRLSLPTLPNFSEGVVVYEKTSSEAAIQKKNKAIVDRFINETKDLSGVYGLYVFRFSDKSSYGVYEDEVFTAASLIKLPVIITLYKESEKGALDLETKYTLRSSDKIAGSGSLYSKPAGSVYTYRELANLMGSQSDNTAFGIIRKILGDEKINTVIKEIGLKKTKLSTNETSPKDIGLIFRGLYEGTLMSDVNSQAVLNSLTKTSYEDWLAKEIPANVRVAHKYGRELHVINDGGIIYAKDPFVLVILSKGVLEKEGDIKIPELSRLIYELESGN